MLPTIQSFVSKAVLPLGLPKPSLGSLVKALTLSGAPRTAALNAVPGLTPVIQAAAQKGYDGALVTIYRYMYHAVIAFGLWSIIAACALRPMDHLLTNRVPKRTGHNSREIGSSPRRCR
ncbi:uncharacterized protein A1O5_06069 [Cladophialophora psammophila CBS 110553]|uniref:Uncharacterized protein n=1 Tax=Cladophialophora psammophila CBS 110553 TaxID=1182543 RepID=W9X2B6_9EURO|nr:uncharacterized protein A1O5_06069 [Cladophialophora psammophila CBS 110553]EXJ71076.1 hypothetical protein A1O5_06069 [Cladophialophora psammophila CBS 110553]